MKNKSILFNFITVFLSVLIGLAACELVLVAIDWSPQRTTSDYLQFGYSTGVPVWDEDGVLEEARPVKVKLFQNDKELFWKTIPNTQFTNSQGFRGERDVSVANSSDAIRVLILGDSCSFLGRKLYADYLYDQLTRDYPETQFEIINASVPGYTSFQGKKVLKRLMQYKPHYAVIYFGWNDHWVLPSGYSDQFHFDLIHSFKTMQLAKIMLAKIMDIRDYRVPLDEYQANLKGMQQELKANDVIPILVAAPAGYGKRGMPKWAFDFYQQYYRMTVDEIRDIPETHLAYANVVAEVAKDSNTIFINGQSHFSRISSSLKPLFRNDLIHLTEKGHQALADQIYSQIKDYNSKNEINWSALVQARSDK
jgi:lysophospholipase L1-like esterase